MVGEQREWGPSSPSVQRRTHVPGSRKLVIITAPFPLRRPEATGPETEGSGEDPSEGFFLWAGRPGASGACPRRHGAGHKVPPLPWRIARCKSPLRMERLCFSASRGLCRAGHLPGHADCRALAVVQSAGRGDSSGARLLAALQRSLVSVC